MNLALDLKTDNILLTRKASSLDHHPAYRICGRPDLGSDLSNVHGAVLTTARRTVGIAHQP